MRTALRTGLALALTALAAVASRAETGADLESTFRRAQEAVSAPLPAEPTPPAPPDDPELRRGLRLLYENVSCADAAYCPTPANETLMTAQALAFKARFDALVAGAGAPQATWKKAGYHVKEFEFDSAVRRGGHPADKVRGFVYFPHSYDACDLRYPATLIVHKLGDNLDSEGQIARLATDSDRGIVMLIWLPHFGPRKADASFITKDFDAFELNVLQALADIHRSYLLLKSIPQVKTDDVGLMGLSLGGMIALISAGIDPVFDRYGTNVGGGDLANIVTYRKTGDVDSQTGRVLKDIDWSVDRARFFLSRFDAITWSLKPKGKTFVMINARGDELIDRRLSLDPLLEGYAAAGAKTTLIMHDGTHVFHAKKVGYWDSLTKVILPMTDFMGPNNFEAQTCRN